MRYFEAQTANSAGQCQIVDQYNLQVGIEGMADLTVANKHTAPHVGNGRVLVISVLINLMEASALAAAEDHLPKSASGSAAPRPVPGSTRNARHPPERTDPQASGARLPGQLSEIGIDITMDGRQRTDERPCMSHLQRRRSKSSSRPSRPICRSGKRCAVTTKFGYSLAN